MVPHVANLEALFARLELKKATYFQTKVDLSPMVMTGLIDGELERTTAMYSVSLCRSPAALSAHPQSPQAVTKPIQSCKSSKDEQSEGMQVKLPM